jgi:RES domain
LSLTVDEQTILADLIRRAKRGSGTYFRSVERRFMDPSQILNGHGTELYGGRFAPIGTKGVYLADSDAGASAEVLARKKRLGGASQISLDKYPRVVFAVDVELDHVISLVRKPRNSEVASIRKNSLDDHLSHSQDDTSLPMQASRVCCLKAPSEQPSTCSFPWITAFLANSRCGNSTKRSTPSDK